MGFSPDEATIAPDGPGLPTRNQQFRKTNSAESKIAHPTSREGFPTWEPRVSQKVGARSRSDGGAFVHALRLATHRPSAEW